MVALTEKKLFQYLINKKIIERKKVESINILVEEKSESRNNVFKIISEQNSFLVKQPKLIDQKNLSTFFNEIESNKIIEKVFNGKIPKFHTQNTDSYNYVIFFELEKDFVSLGKKSAYDNIDLIIEVCNFILQNTITKEANSTANTFFKPFFINISQLKKAFINKPNHQRLKSFCLNQENQKYLEKIGEIWDDRIKKDPVFIHCDLRLDNILLKDKEFKIIDWELATFGDKLWDLAYFITFIICDMFRINPSKHRKVFMPQTVNQILDKFYHTFEKQITDEVFHYYIAIVLLLIHYHQDYENSSELPLFLAIRLIESPKKETIYKFCYDNGFFIKTN